MKKFPSKNNKSSKPSSRKRSDGDRKDSKYKNSRSSSPNSSNKRYELKEKEAVNDKIQEEVKKELWPMRLNKFVAYCGKGSRRKTAEFVKEGQVTVNGELEINPAVLIQTTDIVTLNGEPIKPDEKMVYILMNKPKDHITTTSDEFNRRTVMDLMKGHNERILPVGRLDRNTTGLLLFTNDGDLAQKLSHPSHQIKKIYHVVLDKELTTDDFDKIKKGLYLADGHAPVDGLSFVEGKPENELGVTIHIGRNRIVRRIFEHLGYDVVKLDRIFYAGLTKKNLSRGRTRELTNQEIIRLKHFKQL